MQREPALVSRMCSLILLPSTSSSYITALDCDLRFLPPGALVYGTFEDRDGRPRL
jgi:hypothetical protein